MEIGIFLVVYSILLFMEANAFYEQRAALEIERKLGFPVQEILLPTWLGFFKYTWILLLAFVVYAFYSYGWVVGGLMALMDFLAMAVIPVPKSKYEKHIKKLEVLGLIGDNPSRKTADKALYNTPTPAEPKVKNEPKSSKTEKVDASKPYQRKNPSTEPDKFSLIETYYVAAIAHIKEPGITNLEKWFSDQPDIRRHYIREYIYLKCFLAYMCTYSGKYADIIDDRTPAAVAEKLDPVFQSEYFAELGISLSEMLTKVKYYLDNVDMNDFVNDLPIVFQEAIGYKYMKAALMDPKNIEDLVDAACNDVNKQFKAFDMLKSKQ